MWSDVVFSVVFYNFSHIMLLFQLEIFVVDLIKCDDLIRCNDFDFKIYKINDVNRNNGIDLNWLADNLTKYNDFDLMI